MSCSIYHPVGIAWVVNATNKKGKALGINGIFGGIGIGSGAFIAGLLIKYFDWKFAFILPGISGSFILLLLGLYQVVILSIKELDLLVLSCLILGCFFGLLLFIRIVKRAYEDFPQQLMSFFSSLVFLSIPLLWKSGVWTISLPNYQSGYIEVFFGLVLGVCLIFVLQKISTTFQDI